MEGQEVEKYLAENLGSLRERKAVPDYQEIGPKPKEPQQPDRVSILVIRVKNGFRIEVRTGVPDRLMFSDGEHVAYVMADVLTIVEAVVRRVELPL